MLEVTVLRGKKVVPFTVFLLGSVSFIIDNNNYHMPGTVPDALLLVILCYLTLIISLCDG